MAGHKIINVIASEDGPLMPAMAELLAINMSEGKEAAAAWREAGYTNVGYYLKDRQSIERHPVFQARLAALRSERKRLSVDPIWGEATWAVMQCFRQAQATKDLKTMLEAARMRLSIAQQAPGPEPEPVAEPETAEKRPVGKPPAPTPQSTTNAAQIRGKLIQKGVRFAPVDEEAA